MDDQENQAKAAQAEGSSEAEATPVVDTADSKDPLVTKALQGGLPKTAQSLLLLGAGSPFPTRKY